MHPFDSEIFTLKTSLFLLLLIFKPLGIKLLEEKTGDA